MKLSWNGAWPTLYHFASISYICYIWSNYQWRVDEEMWTLCITLCHFASIPGGTPSHRYRYLHSTTTLVHQFSPQILQLFLVKYKRRCGWKRSMFQFHLSFFQHGHRHRYQSVSTQCPENFSLQKWEEKKCWRSKRARWQSQTLYMFRIYVAFTSDFRKCLDLSLELRLGLL